MPPSHKGCVDWCLDNAVAGWGALDDAPARLVVLVDGAPVGTLACDIPRSGFAELGLPANAGFYFRFPKPLQAGELVEVRHLDGVPLENSPVTPEPTRRQRLLTGITTQQRGLEFGPLNKPLLTRPPFDVSYVDHASRAELLRKYGVQANAAWLDDIAPVDFVWPGGPAREHIPGVFDYCLASHVIEHIADPITWLGELASLLRPGGRINLAIPERSRTFDRNRALSTPAQVIDAYHRKLTRPSFGQVFDHIAFVTPDGSPPPGLTMVQEAYGVARAVEAEGVYADVHCHVWTLDSFRECWAVIQHLGLLPLRLAEGFGPTASGNEFIVCLVKD